MLSGRFTFRPLTYGACLYPDSVRSIDAAVSIRPVVGRTTPAAGIHPKVAMFKIDPELWFWLTLASLIPLGALAFFFAVQAAIYKDLFKEWQSRWESGRDARSDSDAVFRKKIEALRAKLDIIRDVLDEEEPS